MIHSTCSRAVRLQLVHANEAYRQLLEQCEEVAEEIVQAVEELEFERDRDENQTKRGYREWCRAQIEVLNKRLFSIQRV